MSTCSFERLVELLDKQLSLDNKLEVLIHLKCCDICRDAIYQIVRDRDREYFIQRPYNIEKNLA
jgi:hypothetical protein